MLSEQSESALRAAIEPYSLTDSERRRQLPDFTYDSYTASELQLAAEKFGYPLPESYCYLFENYSALDIGEREYCGRRGLTEYVNTTALIPPWRGGASYDGWFEQVRHSLRRASHLIPAATQLLPFAYAAGGRVVCFDLGNTEVGEPPLVLYSPTEHPSSNVISFIADGLTQFLHLPKSGSEPPDRVPCRLSDVALEWYANHDALVDSADMSLQERRMVQKSRTAPDQM